MKILGILIIYYTNPDKNGNTSYAFRYIDTLTGKTAEGQTGGGESNVLCSRIYIRPEFDCYAQGGSSDSCFYIQQQMNCRDMQKMEYAGSQPQDIAKYINKKLEE